MKEQLQYQPSTIAKKLRRLKQAINFVAHQHFTDIDIHQSSAQYKDLLSTWINSLGKPIAFQWHKREIKLDSQVAHTRSPNNILEHKEAKEKVEIARENLRVGKFDVQDIKLLIAFAVAILVYKNGQRSEVADNLAINEFEPWRDHSEELVVIPCVNHKTGLLVVQNWWCTKMIWAIFLITIFSEKKVAPVAGCSHLTYNGKHYT